MNWNCTCCGMSRREFLQFTSQFAASLGVTLGTGGCQQSTSPGIRIANKSDDQPVKIGYLPIIDSSPLLVAHAKKFYEAQGLHVEQPQMFGSWAKIVDAFLARQVNVIHVLMPTAIWLRYGYNFPTKIVAWNHTNGSALTVLPNIEKPQELGGLTIAVPYWYSIHNVVLQQLLQQQGLKVVRSSNNAVKEDQVNLVVVPPPEMVSALTKKTISGYIVAEPFNALAESLKVGKILRFTGDVWKDHACCVVCVHEANVNEHPEWTQRVVNALVQAQHWMRDNRTSVAEILSKEGGKYTPHPLLPLQRALTYYDLDFYGKQGAIQHPNWRSYRINFQPYPFPSYTEELVRLLQKTVVGGDNTFIRQLQPKQVAQELVDDSFAKRALQLFGGAEVFGLPASLSRTETIAGL